MEELLNVPILLDEGAYDPVKAHEEDAGFDLKTPYAFTMNPGEEITVNLGVHMLIPRGYVGFLKSKSGLNVKYGITSEGVVDAGYTGSIVAKLRRDADQKNPLLFEAGDKITQIVVLPIPEVRLTKVRSFMETDRGNNGFGSSGR